ncbi:MAG: PQQ-dependent sugar dehydrogenase, partial [Bacteroidota bacterium]
MAFSTGYPGQAMGIVFDDNGTGYVWEKSGSVWILDAAGNKSASPLIDISEEVGDWRDFGLVGFALDPSFLSNGYIYLFYVVDRHYFMNYGTGAYNSAANEYFDAAFGRITRYTATSASGYTTVDYSSRQILLGESISTGVPILHLSHGVGTLLFGEDETLLISTGDGASFFGTDVGGAAHGTYTAQALVDGIITPEENVGSYRSQMLSSMNGKVLRIDKSTGDGVSSNPWYDASEPRATRSRVWALGLRNPSRMALKPGTGTPNPADGNPGVLMVGDVGWDSWEELNIVKQGGMNFGWPVYEGVGKHPTYDPENTLNLEAPTPGGCGQTHYQFEELLQPWNGSAPSYPDPCGGGNIDPSSYDLMVYYGPAVAWKHSEDSAYASMSDNTYEYIGASATKGNQFRGNASIGGTWYQGSQYAAEYANLYFHADYGRRWINVFSFNADWELDSVGVFDAATVGRPINMASHPTKDEIFYIRHSNEVRKYTYSPTGNQVPTADATSDAYYSASNSLTVTFDGTGSSDPDIDPLDYLWNFGDGSPTSTAASPSHTFSTVGSGAATFTVTLTVTDPGGLSSSTTMQIYLNNTPPVISSTSLDGISTYSVISPESLPLSAVVSDAEHVIGDLTFAWQAVLHHDNHTHPEPIDNNQTSSTLISPIGCDGPTYWYRVYLTVTDPEGLAANFQHDIFPLCAPLVVEDHKIYTLNEAVEVDVFANDYSNDALDLSSFAFKVLPSNGTVSFDAGTQKVTYTQDGSATKADTFFYQINDVDGDSSAWAMVEMEWIGEPTVTIQKPIDGSTVDNKMVKIEYSVTGDTTLVTGVEFQLNSDPVKQDPTVSGIYRYYDIPVGSERFIARLLGAGNTP